MPAPERPATVRAVRDIADGVRLLELVPEDGARPYPPGGHLDVAVLLGDRPDVRSYSLVGDGPRDGAYRIAVKAVASGRGGSAYVRGLPAGARVLISEPESHFELRHGAPGYLLVAGGIGITPLVGMAAVLARAGARVELLYATRTRAQLAFAEELGTLLGDRVETYISSEGSRLDLARALERLHPEGELYLCGPLPMREAALRAWSDAGRPRERLQFETFGSGGQLPAEDFVVRVRDHGDRAVTVPANRTLAEALRDAGVDVITDCRRGECGLCALTVLEAEGRLDHRDVFLDATERAEGRCILACVSRAVGGAITVDTGHRPG
jgi:vanillate O-demethylase ferredoxin subunit